MTNLDKLDALAAAAKLPFRDWSTSKPNLDFAAALIDAYPELRAAVEERDRLRAAAEAVATRWFDWLEGEADQTLRASMIALRAALHPEDGT